MAVKTSPRSGSTSFRQPTGCDRRRPAHRVGTRRSRSVRDRALFRHDSDGRSKSAGWSYVNEPRTTAWRRTIAWAVTSGWLSRPRRSRVPPTRGSRAHVGGPRRADRVDDEVEAPLVTIQCGGGAQPSRGRDTLRVHVANMDLDVRSRRARGHQQALGTDSDHQGRRGERVPVRRNAAVTTAIGSRRRGRSAERHESAMRIAPARRAARRAPQDGSSRRTAVPHRPKSTLGRTGRR